MEQAFYLRLAERMMIAGCVPLLLYIGYRLFDKGATGKMQLAAKADGRFARITNVSPGAFCFLLATVLGTFILNHRVEIRSGGVTISGLDGTGPRQVAHTPPPENAGLPTPNEPSPSLSGTIQAVYAEFGMEMQRLLSRVGAADVEQLRHALETIVDEKLGIRATRQALYEIIELEQKVSQGNSDQASKALALHREDYLGK